MRHIAEKIKKLFYRGETFFIFEALQDHIRLIEARVHVFRKKAFVTRISEFANGDLATLARVIEGARRRLRDGAVIAVFGPHLATTIYSSITIVRDNPQEVITEADLDNLISQAIWKFFDRARPKIAKKMGVSDLDVVLTDVKVRGVKLDGHKVINPLGFRARTLEVAFSQTFLTRALGTLLQDAFPAGRVALVAEAGTLWTEKLARAVGQPRFLLAHISKTQTELFFADEGRHAFVADFDWGRDTLIDFLSRELGLPTAAAHDLYHAYLDGQCSVRFDRRLQGILAGEFAELAKRIQPALRGLQSKHVYVQSFFRLPRVLFGGGFRNAFRTPVSVLPISPNDIGQNPEFQLEWKQTVREPLVFPLHAYFSEWQTTPYDKKIGHLVRRRVRWLSPTLGELNSEI